MSPELLSSQKYSFETDIWCVFLGIEPGKLLSLINYSSASKYLLNVLSLFEKYAPFAVLACCIPDPSMPVAVQHVQCRLARRVYFPHLARAFTAVMQRGRVCSLCL